MNDVFNDKAWLDAFWGDSKYFTGPPLTDELIRQAEERLGYKLPPGYLRLLRIQNGGSPRRPYVHVAGLRGWTGGYLGIDSLRGVGQHFWKIEANVEYYPKVGLVIGDTPSGGHDYVMLDYRQCGRAGEPRVVHAFQGCRASQLTVLAPDFASFVAALCAHPPGEETAEE